MYSVCSYLCRRQGKKVSSPKIIDSVAQSAGPKHLNKIVVDENIGKSTGNAYKYSSM